MSVRHLDTCAACKELREDVVLITLPRDMGTVKTCEDCYNRVAPIGQINIPVVCLLVEGVYVGKYHNC